MAAASAPLAALLLCAVSGAGSAQLANGGAESGSLAPWTPNLSGAPSGNTAIIKAVATQVQTEPPVFPQSGGWFFSFATQVAGAPGSFVTLSQSVPVLAGQTQLACTGKIQTEYDDAGEVQLEMLGLLGAVLATTTSAPLISNNAWQSFYLDADVPPGTQHCRVTLRGTVTTGMAVNVFWDALALVTSPWALVGSGLPGTAGLPQIDGDGPLLAGEPMTIALEDARPNSTAWLVTGLSQLGAPFKGGVMVPHPDLLLALPTGPSGAIELTTPWPAGLPPGLTLWFQWWVQDPAGPAGFASSAGLTGTTP